jgi:hypothetical protein
MKSNMQPLIFRPIYAPVEGLEHEQPARHSAERLALLRPILVGLVGLGPCTRNMLVVSVKSCVRHRSPEMVR